MLAVLLSQSLVTSGWGWEIQSPDMEGSCESVEQERADITMLQSFRNSFGNGRVLWFDFRDRKGT